MTYQQDRVCGPIAQHAAHLSTPTMSAYSVRQNVHKEFDSQNRGNGGRALCLSAFCIVQGVNTARTKSQPEFLLSLS